MESASAKYATPTTIDNFFDKLEALFEDGQYSKSMIANFDESMIQCTAKASSVVFGHSASHEQPHITLGVCIFADGSYCGHLVIYPLKELPPEVTNGTLFAAYPKLCFPGYPSGCITIEIFKSYLTKIVLPYFAEQREIPGSSRRGLLLLDDHSSSHISKEIMNLLGEHDIDVLTFVSHASHILQPLELSVFDSFKRRLCGKMSAFKSLSLDKKRESLVENAFDCLYHALVPSNIQLGFARAGITPLSRDEALSHPGITKDPTVPTRKRLTDNDFDDVVLTNVEAKKRSRGRPKKTGRKVAKKMEEDIPYDNNDSEILSSDDEE